MPHTVREGITSYKFDYFFRLIFVPKRNISFTVIDRDVFDKHSKSSLYRNAQQLLAKYMKIVD